MLFSETCANQYLLGIEINTVCHGPYENKHKLIRFLTVLFFIMMWDLVLRLGWNWYVFSRASWYHQYDNPWNKDLLVSLLKCQGSLRFRACSTIAIYAPYDICSILVVLSFPIKSYVPQDVFTFFHPHFFSLPLSFLSFCFICVGQEGDLKVRLDSGNAFSDIEFHDLKGKVQQSSQKLVLYFMFWLYDFDLVFVDINQTFFYEKVACFKHIQQIF